MVKVSIVLITVIYTMMAFGTWIGFNQRYVRASLAIPSPSALSWLVRYGLFLPGRRSAG